MNWEDFAQQKNSEQIAKKYLMDVGHLYIYAIKINVKKIPKV